MQLQVGAALGGLHDEKPANTFLYQYILSKRIIFHFSIQTNLSGSLLQDQSCISTKLHFDASRN
jgi:hypothetical protein